MRAPRVTKKGLLWAGLGLGFVVAIGSAGAWLLVNRTSWAGPLLANALRAVIGADRVARLEDIAYSAQDRVNHWRHRHEAPRARWVVPPHVKVPDKPKPTSETPAQKQPEFRPADVGPLSTKWHAPGDGEWVAMADPRHRQAPPLMYKTLLHPDPTRSWADLFVAAISLDGASLHLCAGKHEPKADPGTPAVERTGRVPPAELPLLLAAFNGGFMAEHGHYGTRVNGVNLLKPRPKSCTVVGYNNDTVQIATWDTIASSEARMPWFRQTPACMYENGIMHVGLRMPESRLWGATLDGDTVIRRSAIGLDASRRTLLVGISNNTTARTLALGMRHAGAVDVAQLDVNWSYPKFLLYQQGEKGELKAQAPVDGFEYNPGEYVSKSAYRDFFYLTRKSGPAAPTAACPSCTAETTR
jgi:hypothetical protein